MNINIESPFTINETANEQIHSKLNSLEEYKMNITQVFLYFKVEAGVASDVVNCEIVIHLPGPVIAASSTDQDFLKAFHDGFTKAKRQLLKKKEMLKGN